MPFVRRRRIGGVGAGDKHTLAAVEAEMALRWTAAGLLEAEKTFRQLKAYRRMLILRQALEAHAAKTRAHGALEATRTAA